MVRIYLDIETYRSIEENVFVDEKIISCGLLVDHEDNSKKKCKLILFNEWDGLNEQTIVAKVNEYIMGIQKAHKFTVICGFNILRFDVPLLICKAVQYSLGKPDVVSKMWKDCLIIDYLQQFLVVNNNRFKGLKLENIVEIAKSLKLKPPEYVNSGSAVKELYAAKEFKEIEKHLKQDLKIIRWLDFHGAKKLIIASVKKGKTLLQLT